MECEPLLQQLLAKRGKDEKLQVFKTSAFSTHSAAIRYWSENVRLAMGMHGGGLYNTLWSSPGTTVIEIRPRYNNQTYGGTLFWELAALKNLSYWTVPVPADNGRFDARIDCTYAVDILRRGLEDEIDPRGPPLDTWYQGPFAPGL